MPYANRRVCITGEVSRCEFVCSIRDEGLGFDVDSVPDPLDPKNLCKPSGRGLLLIRRFMDQMIYNDKGNELRMVKCVPTSPSL